MKTMLAILFSFVMATGTLYGQTPDTPPPVPMEEQPEVLTRGPVNEAFAQPVNVEEEGGFIVPEAPPPDIEEIPPEEAPAGDRFAWIPGYWAWDSERDEYIWISGCWRAVPPGKYWIPGYWAEVEDGWIWVAGFWAPVSEEEIEYLPEPPPVSYIEPIVKEAPDRIWVPSCWYWSHGRYTLRAGYWITARKDWIWIPSHYVWTPLGYVFVEGYWDYPFRERGVLFAPVYFPGYIHGRIGFSYSLNIVLDLGSLEFGIFTRPKYCHYYFGDYYDSFYIGIGIFPWFECVTRHTWYDPIYLHDRWRHQRDNPRWRQHERHEYARRRVNKDLRPPRTYRELEHGKRKITKTRQTRFELAAPIKKFVEKKNTTFKFRKHKPEDRRQISRRDRDVSGNDSKRSQRKPAPRTGRTVKKHDPPMERKTGNVKESRQSNFNAALRIKKPAEKKTAASRPRQQKQEAQKQVSRNTGGAEKNAGERNQRKSTVTVSRPDRKVVKSVPRAERRKVQEQSEREAQVLRPREPGRPRPMISQNNLKPSNIARREPARNKPVRVKVNPSAAVKKKENRTSPKKRQSLPAEEREKKEKRDDQRKKRK